MKKVAFAVLGCKVNQYETEAMAGLFRRCGYEVVDFSAAADVYIVHTCAVTQQAERKSRQIIRQAIRKNPDAVIAATGCYSQIAAAQISRIPGVDVVVGTQDRGKIVAMVEAAATGRRPVITVDDIMQATEFEELPVHEYPSRTRASLKIEEGCDQFCAYCIVPYTRGPVRSRAIAAIENEAERLAAQGFREIVLTGIHLGAYGKDTGGRPDLADVIEALQAVDGIERLRLSSIEPTEVSERLLAMLAASPKVCPHLHIPLQSGDDTVLRRMNRRYSTAEYAAVIDRVRATITNVGISTDVIVGFPGETAEQFTNTCNFVEEVRFGRMHIFQYSRRTGTPAAKMPNQISPAEKERRSKQLLGIAARMAGEFHRRFIGHTLDVLAERMNAGTGLMEGLTGNYIRVMFPGSDCLRGEIVPVLIKQATPEHLAGELVNRPDRCGGREINQPGQQDSAEVPAKNK